MKSYETDGKEYFFVSRQTMENFIQKRKFIEFGEFKGCLYGTSKDSIKRALKTGKICVLKVLPEASWILVSPLLTQGLRETENAALSNASVSLNQ